MVSLSGGGEGAQKDIMMGRVGRRDRGTGLKDMKRAKGRDLGQNGEEKESERQEDKNSTHSERGRKREGNMRGR